MDKIVIIEDDMAISQMYRMKLEATNFEVYLANNGVEGIQLCRQVLPQIILLDLVMPKLNGIETLKLIREIEEFKNTPVIILTNKELPNGSDEFNQLKITDYIVKANVTPSQVVTKVRETLQNQ